MIGRVVQRVSSSIFVGRVVERARLEAALEAARQGEPGLVLIGGEAGIGKSRLAAELATMARAHGFRVVLGHCLQAMAATLPFAPWVQLARQLLLDERDAGEPDGPAASGLADVIPEYARLEVTDSALSDHDDQLQLFLATLALVRRRAEDRPLLLVIEDLHWADASSLDLLRFITTGFGTESLLMLATFRSDALPADHPLPQTLGELVRLSHVARFDLAPFSASEVTDQMTGIAGLRPPDDVTRSVFARSDGNPFVVEELAGAPDADLPTTLRDVLAARMATLSAETRKVVLAAAAIGREVEHGLLAHVAGVSEAQLLTAIREATARHVLVPATESNMTGFAFRHALIQEYAYGELLPTERIALHRAIVQALLAGDGSSGEIARHAVRAGDLALALARSADAAEEAVEDLAFAEALAHVDQALAFWSRVHAPAEMLGRELTSLLMLGARCAAAIGAWDRAAELGHMALDELGPERRHDRISILLAVTYWHYFADDVPAGAETLGEAAELLPEYEPSPLRVYVLTELANLANRRGRVDEGQRLAKEALEVSRAIGPVGEEVRALVRLAEGTLQRLQPETSSEMLADAERVAAERLGEADDFYNHVIFRKVDAAVQEGGFARAIEIADGGVALAARIGRSGQRAPALKTLKVQALSALGRWAEAEALMTELRRDRSVVIVRMATRGFVEILIRQGRIDEAAALVRATDFGYAVALDGSWILRTRIRVAHGQGRWDDARAAADEALALYGGLSDGDPLSVLAESVRVEADRAELARGRRRSAVEADARRVGLDRLLQLRRLAQSAVARGGAGRLIEAVLAMAEAEGSRLEGQSDPALWHDAARQRAALAQPWETAYARFRQAEAILARRDARRDALAPLLEARRIAESVGARPLVEQIDSLAHRGRLRLEHAPRKRVARQATTTEGVVAALTARESEVLSLVAAGHTNREIGQALFISEKTASVHVTNAMNKLGALSRYEAAASATRLGMLAVAGDADGRDR